MTSSITKKQQQKHINYYDKTQCSQAFYRKYIKVKSVTNHKECISETFSWIYEPKYLRNQIFMLFSSVKRSLFGIPFESVEIFWAPLSCLQFCEVVPLLGRDMVGTLDCYSLRAVMKTYQWHTPLVGSWGSVRNPRDPITLSDDDWGV